MSEISLAWLMSKVTSPVVGATKLSHIDTACKACDLKLTVEEMKYLEECYKPHPLVGVIERNNQIKQRKYSFLVFYVFVIL